MPNLTTKELIALEDQIGFEKMLHCKYKDAAQQSTDPGLSSSYEKYANQHKQNFTTLLNFLK